VEDNNSSAEKESAQRTEDFLELLGAHERSLFTYVFALAPNWQDAEEIMQRVRIRVWQQFDQYDPAKPFDAWVRAIAYYLVLAYRKERSRQREFFTERVLESISKGYESGAETANVRREALRKCVDKLDTGKRNLLHLYYSSAKGPSSAIARQLSMTPNALRQSMYRIRKLLFDCVERTLQAQLRE
jgi:RNA polymerase sigma-70 factor, ECF subfamily